MKKRLLFGCDASTPVEKVIADLKSAGISKGSEMLVLSVADVIGPPLTGGGIVGIELPETYAAMIRQAESRTRREVKKTQEFSEGIAKQIKKAFPSWKCTAEACADSPAWAIVKKAEKWHADLILVGSRERNVLGQIVFGSVAQKVISEAPCSVRIVHQRAMDGTTPPRIVIGVDGSIDSQYAIQEVAGRSWKKGSAVHLVSVIDHQSTLYAFSSSMSENRIQKAVKDEKQWLTNHLKEAQKKLQASGLVVSALIQEGNPKKTVLEEARRWGADCVFVGARGLRGFEKFLIGSVSSAIASGAHCTVEVVRPQRF